ncbi:MAG: PQQ-dependent sugar dehydrogenase [Candidatus Binatia bacterium]
MTVRRLLALAILCALRLSTARADSLVATGSPSPASTFVIDEGFVTGVNLVTDFRFLPDGRMVIVTKDGNVLLRPAAGGALVSAGTFAVDTESEKGLLGVAVDPDFTTTGRLFFYYSAAAGTDNDRHRVVARTLGGNTLGPETVLLHDLRGPENHDGGALDVGPDGFLYVGVGDTGCNSGQAPEPIYTPTNFYPTCLSGHPQNNGAGNGKILRIARDGSIPPANPLVGAGNVTACGAACGDTIAGTGVGAPRTDVFAWGFRNPFRLWVDPQTGRVWVGDVGEISYEEITIVQPGRHHGWPWREGMHGWPMSKCRDVRVGTGGGVPVMDQDCVDPVFEYAHPTGIAVTGGQIVDSCAWPAAFRGRYYFGDFAGSVWTLTPNGARDGVTGGATAFAAITGGLVAIHTGTDGALYLASHYGSRIARIAPLAPEVCGNTTTSTTATSSTTSSTSTPPTSTTSTTATTSTSVPDPCAAAAGTRRASCEIDEALAGSLCGTEPLGVGVERAIRTRLTSARALLDRAAADPRRQRRLARRADRVLATILPRATQAVHGGKTSAACGATLDALVARLRAAIAPLRAR